VAQVFGPRIKTMDPASQALPTELVKGIGGKGKVNLDRED